MAKRGKVVGLSISGIAAVVMVAAGFAALPRLEEEWWMYRLESQDDSTRKQAAMKLGDLGSIRAVPHLVAAMRNAVAQSRLSHVRIDDAWAFVGGMRAAKLEPGQGCALSLHRPHDSDVISQQGELAYFSAILRVGKPALPILIRCVPGDAELADGLVAWAIAEISEVKLSQDELPWRGEAALAPENLLFALSHDDSLNLEVRVEAKKALRRIQGSE